MGLGREELEPGILVHVWRQCLHIKKEAVCLQLTLFRGLLQNDVILITFLVKEISIPGYNHWFKIFAFPFFQYQFKINAYYQLFTITGEEGNLKYLLINSLFSQMQLFCSVYILCHLFYLHCCSMDQKSCGTGIGECQCLLVLFCYGFIGLLLS